MALREIRRHQKSTDTLIPKAAVTRLVRQVMIEDNDVKEVQHDDQLEAANAERRRQKIKEIAKDFSQTKRIQSTGLECIHQAVEALTVDLMEDTNICAIHAGRVTIRPKDMLLAARLKGGPLFSRYLSAHDDKKKNAELTEEKRAAERKRRHIGIEYLKKRVARKEVNRNLREGKRKRDVFGREKAREIAEKAARRKAEKEEKMAKENAEARKMREIEEQRLEKSNMVDNYEGEDGEKVAEGEEVAEGEHC